MRKQRIRALLLVIGAMLALGAGCAKAQSEGTVPRESQVPQEETKISLSLFYSGDDVNWVTTMEELGEKFMREYPGIELNMENSESGVYTENLKAKEAVNEFPDVFEIQDPSMFVEAGMLGEIPNSVSTLVEEPVTIDGKVWAVPLYTTTYGIVYNQVIFKKYGIQVPKTYGEFLQVCETLKKYGVTPLALGGSKTDTPGYWLNYFFQTDVVAKVPDWQEKKNKGQVSFADEESMKMLADYRDLTSGNYILEDSVNMKDTQLVARMVDGEVAMIYTGPWIFSQIIDAYPQAAESDKDTLGETLPEDQVNCRLGWFFMPDGQGNPVAINEFGAEWAISSACREDGEKLKAAVTFFQYFYQKSNYKEILQSMYAIPTTKEAVLYPSPGVQQRLLVDYRYAQKSKSYLGNNETPEGFDVAMYKILNSVATEVMSVETAAEQLDEIWNETKEP